MKRFCILLMALCLHVFAAHAQQVFTIDGYVDEEIADSCYNIYLGDEYFKIQDEPVATVPIVNKRFTYSIPLEKVTAGRIRCIFPGGELCSDWIDLFFVPGETIKLTVHNGYFNWDLPDTYKRKVNRGVMTVRNATNMQSPHLPKLKGKIWKDAYYESWHSGELYVKDVIFGKDETVLRLMSEEHLRNMTIHKSFYLKDDNGNKYKFKRMVYGVADANNGPEARVYGVYCAFEPLPKDVHHFSLCMTTETGYEELLRNIQKAPKKKTKKANFQMNIKISEGIDDTGYLIYLYNKDRGYTRTQIADIPATGKTCTFKTYIDKPYLTDITATFPDGSVCSHCVRIVSIPGETAEIKVMNGTYHLDGTNFYKAWGDASDFAENSIPYRTAEERVELLKNYLKQHATEEGCVVYYVQYRLLPRETLEELIPQEVWDGRLRNILRFLHY